MSKKKKKKKKKKQLKYLSKKLKQKLILPCLQVCSNKSLFFKSPDDAFRAGLRKLGPKINIPEVFLTRKAKNMNHGSPLFPTI